MRKIAIFLAFMLFPCVAAADAVECDEIPFDNERNLCFAMTTTNATYCEKIKDNDIKQSCLASVHKDKSYCKRMTNKVAKRNCIKRFKSRGR